MPLPIGMELDHEPGVERLFAFFSDAPLDEAAARAAVSRGLARARASGAGLVALRRIDLPVDQFSVWFRKP